MRILFTEAVWEDYLHWQRTDKAMLKRANELIKDTQRNPFQGIGKPEPLRWQLRNCWSRRIDREHRLVYEMEGETLTIIACRYHY